MTLKANGVTWLRRTAPPQGSQRSGPKTVVKSSSAFALFWDEQIICKPPWGSVKARFFQKGRPNHLFAGIDASPLVNRETEHKTYTLHPSRKRERRRSIYGPASRRNVWSEERFLFSQTQICKDLA